MSAPNKSYDPVEVEALKPEEIERMRDEALAAFAAADDLDALAGGQGRPHRRHLPAGPRQPRDRRPAPAAKADAGKRVGQARGAVNKALAARQAELEAERDARVLVEEAVDVTLPYDRVPAGARHPLTTMMERVEDVFVAMGYEVAEGPEVEAEWFNFDALNFGPDHPARADAGHLLRRGPRGRDGDESGVVLRTHTSPVQIRSLLDREPPVYVVCPGPGLPHRRAGRHAHPGLPPGRAAGRRRGPDHGRPQGHPGPHGPVAVRRGHEDPAAAELLPLHRAVRRDGHGLLRLPRRVRRQPRPPCRTCSSEGWIELGGCGMVNPRVLTACGVDPEKYSGFAFGFGIERMLMFRHNVEDMRDMVEGDVRFTRPFGMEICEASIDTLLHAFARGVNFVDTAEYYGEGHSEEVIGEALRRWDGDKIYVATKVRPIRVAGAHRR